jgi:membrane-bound metal-dependent hydrolase YbcI (DUF457 family)
VALALGRDPAVVAEAPTDVALALGRPSSGRTARWSRWASIGGRIAVQGAGIGALGAILGVATVVVLAAAERPSPLSGPAQHGFPGWMVGPLAHRLPGLPDSPPMLQDDLTRALAILGLAWLVALVCAARLPSPVVWGGVVATQAVFLLGPPLSLTDVFNYLHYGRMPARFGLNPYVALPVAAPQDAAYRFTNWHHLPSPYGPLFTALTEALSPLSVPTAYWTWKVVLLAASVGTLVVVWVTARRLGRSPRAAIVLVGLNPLVAVYGIGGDHNDALMVLCGVAAVALAVAGWREGSSAWLSFGAGACVALAAGFKPSAIVLAPIVVLACRRRLPALGGAGSAGVLVLAVVALLYGGHLPAAGIQDRFVNPLSVPNVLAALAGHGGLTARDRTVANVVLALAAVGATAVVAWRRRWLPGAAGFVMLAAILTLGWTMPWYVWWVLPFAALARTRALTAACVVLTAWLALGAIPQMPRLIHTFGYYPTRSATGRANHLYTERYLK